MAHNLEIRNGKASMMYVGQPPWHGLGTKLNAPATAEDAILAARMDWDVMKVPLFAADPQGSVLLKGKYAVVRKDLWGRSDSPWLGLVSESYTPLQNRDAFSFFDPIVGENAAVYHTAGVLGEGERIWILAKLPGEIQVVGEDVTDKYLLLSNNHDGEGAVQIKFTPIRVVCQNTLTMALNQGPTIRVAHTRDMEERLAQAEDLLGVINTRYSEIEKDFQRMAKVQMVQNRLNEYLGLVFPDPPDGKNGKAAAKVKVSRQAAARLFEEGKGNQLAGVKGSLWAAYNGVAELIDHHSPRTQRHLASIWFGSGYQVKARAFTAAKDRVTAWVN